MTDDTDPPTEDAQEYEPEPVTLGEAEEGLVFALDGVSQIAEILGDMLLYGEDSRKYLPQIMQLKRLVVLVGSYASRLAEHYDVSLERPSVRDIESGAALQNARMSAGLSFEDLADASGVDLERLRDAEGAEPQVALTDKEWIRLAVVLEGHTLAEFQAEQMAKGPVKWLVKSGEMLESAKHLVQFYFSTDDPSSEDT